MKNPTHENETVNETIHTIYDRIFKRIFSMSSLATIHLINGLFDAKHPLDSEIIYLNKEFVSTGLDKRFADVFLQINGITYHLEAQMQKDSSIVMRVFEYGLYHALESWNDENRLVFPEPVIIYLDTVTNVPTSSALVLDFGTQGTFTYKVNNFVYQNHDLTELNQKKMVILIPFQLLKLRKLIAKETSKENFKALQNLIFNDILTSIKSNLNVGNITLRDANELKDLTIQLYDHIYQHYEESGGIGQMRQLLEGALVLENDKYWDHFEEVEENCKRMEKALASQSKELTSQSKELASKKEELASKKEELASKKEELASKEKELASKDKELALAKYELEQLKQLLNKQSN